MRNPRRKLLPLCIAASIFSGVSVNAAAVGVGEIHVQSFLGTPLQAEVPLSHLGDLDITQLKVELGTQTDYTAMGVEYTYLHSQLKIEPFIKNGEGYVRITTREPISEPYINFVLNLRWPQGQLVREFTVLLDPPKQSVATSATSVVEAITPEAVPSETAEPVRAAAPVSHPHRKVRHAREATAKVESPVKAGEGRYTIQSGDSLWRIANRARTGQVPVEQVMAAIQALNPNAFINGNPNLLKAAVTIRLPDTEQIASANSAAAATSSSTNAELPAATSEKAAAAEPERSPAITQLSEENSALKAQVAELSTNVASLNQSLTQSEQRLHQLESQLNDVLQQMQQQRATVAALSGTVETQSAPITQSTGSVINQVNAADLHGPAPAHTPWWVHLLYWLGIGGAVTWAIREHFWPQRRLAAVTVGGQTMPIDVEKTTPPAVARTAIKTPSNIKTVEDAAELSLELDDLSLPAIESLVHKVEPAPQLLNSGEESVDASITAGVFVAFGRFSEAERLLREAIAREPQRIDLKLQLLDVLMQSDQPGAFDDLAVEIEREACTPETLAELAVMRENYRPRR